MTNSKFNCNYIYRFPFLLNEETAPFLKKDNDTDLSFVGNPIEDFFYLNTDELSGVFLDISGIETLTKIIFLSLLSNKDKLKIRNSKVYLHIYTMSRLDDILLFHLWQITTQVEHQSREDWELEYSLGSRSCCKKTFFSDEKNQQKSIDTSQLSSLIKENCKYKSPYINIFTNVYSHFLNQKNLKAKKIFKNTVFNAPIRGDSLVSNTLRPVPFCYNKREGRSLTCQDLYDSIVLDTTGGKIIEHNFEKFISDSLFTCLNYQEKIDSLYTPFFSSKEHRLLYVSVYL